MHRILTILVLITFVVQKSDAQTTLDAELMDKGQLCSALIYSSDKWNQYWEGQTLISNGNIGTFERKAYTPMIAYGITNHINFIAMAPYMQTSTTGGTVRGYDGFQDFNLALKSRIFNKSLGGGLKVALLGIIGGSIPTQHYNNDAGPTSLGLGCPEIYGRAIVNLEHKSGLFLRPYASYHYRSDAALERNFYYTGQGIYSDRIDIEDNNLVGAALGVFLFDRLLRFEADARYFNTLGGTDIRRNEMPLANAQMDAKSLSILARYYLHPMPSLGFVANYSQVWEGRNVGKSSTFSLGLTYQFQLIKNSTNETK
jgi:hypothetical protein